jgi:predicted membrane-bound spermidine synthase
MIRTTSISVIPFIWTNWYGDIVSILARSMIRYDFRLHSLEDNILPQNIHLTNIPLELYETNQYGETKKHKATIDEILMDSKGHPYQLLITWNGKTRRVAPKYLDGKLQFNGRYNTFDGYIEDDIHTSAI